MQFIALCKKNFKKFQVLIFKKFFWVEIAEN